MYHIAIIGGGAAGLFAGLAASSTYSAAKIVILEKTNSLLAKVRASGGGRCNITHACFDLAQLIQHYPRGGKELIGPFHQFQPRDTIAWFTAHGVILKAQRDGRVFPITNRSETIVQCLLTAAQRAGMEILLNQQIQRIIRKNNKFEILFRDKTSLPCSCLIIATGGNSEGYDWAKNFGHTIIPPIPALFSFTVPSSPFKELAGISIDAVEVSISATHFKARGPLLITHKGFSGPCILTLSSLGARYVHKCNYQVEFSINWLPLLSVEDIFHQLILLKKRFPQKRLVSENIFEFSKNLWKLFLNRWKEISDRRVNDMSLKNLRLLSQRLYDDRYVLEGKASDTEEFVTCGGIALKEINFKTMESTVCPGLFFAGEILDIDGLTGGFNLQNAWTTGFIAGSSAIRRVQLIN